MGEEHDTPEHGTQGSVTPSSGLRRRVDAVRALQGLRGHVVRALVPAVALAVVAGGTAGAVTIVSLASSEVPVVADTADDTADDTAADVAEDTGDADGASDPAAGDGDGSDGPAGQDAPPASGTESDDPGADATSADGGSGTAPVTLTFEEAVAEHGPPDYAHILTRRFPGAQWSLNGNDPVDGLVWNSSGPRPTKAELDAMWPAVAEELAAERAAQEAAEAAAAAEREAELEARRNDPDVQALLDSCDPREIWGGPDYAHILTRRFPGAQWSLNGNDPVDGLVWNSSGPRPTKAELDAMWADVAREMALEMDPEELARWCGTGDEVFVDGVLRPRGWVGGADDPQPDPPAITRDNCSIMPSLPDDGGGGTIDVWKDPTGAKNFDMVIGISYHELGFRIAEAHGFWGDRYCGVGFSVNGDRTFAWRSSKIEEHRVVSILTSLEALPANTPDPGDEEDVTPAPESVEEAEEGEEAEDGSDDDPVDGVDEDEDEDEADGSEGDDGAED